MSHKWKTELYKAAALTFEGLCFMFPETEEANPFPSGCLGHEASVEFWGPFHGALVIRLASRLLPIIAANMLGDEATPSTRQQEDAVGEIANVICGNLLPRLAGSGAVFNIGVPGVDAGPETTAKDGTALRAEMSLMLEQEPVTLRLFADQNAVPYLEEQGT